MSNGGGSGGRRGFLGKLGEALLILGCVSCLIRIVRETASTGQKTEQEFPNGSAWSHLFAFPKSQATWRKMGEGVAVEPSGGKEQRSVCKVDWRNLEAAGRVCQRWIIERVQRVLTFPLVIPSLSQCQHHCIRTSRCNDKSPASVG